MKFPKHPGFPLLAAGTHRNAHLDREHGPGRKDI